MLTNPSPTARSERAVIARLAFLDAPFNKITTESVLPHYCRTRHGERSAHDFKAVFAQAVSLSVWQTLQALGIFDTSVATGLSLIRQSRVS